MHNRLREIRQKSGFSSASEAAQSFGWNVATYTGHENGSRGFGVDVIEKYATAFRADAAYLAFGTTPNSDRIANVPAPILIEVLTLVLGHEITTQLSASDVAELVVEICVFVNRNGSNGLSNVIDFQMSKLARGA